MLIFAKIGDGVRDPKIEPKMTPKSSPKGLTAAPGRPKIQLGRSFKFLVIFYTVFRDFEPPKGVPKGTPNRSKIGLGGQGPPKGHPRPARGSPRSHQGAILSLCRAHFGAWWAHVGVIGGPPGQTTSPRSHHASKPPCRNWKGAGGMGAEPLRYLISVLIQ